MVSKEEDSNEVNELQTFCGSLCLETRFDNQHDWAAVHVTSRLQPIRLDWIGRPGFNFFQTDTGISCKVASQISSSMSCSPITDVQIEVTPCLSLDLPVGPILHRVIHFLTAFLPDSSCQTALKRISVVPNRVFCDDLRRNSNFTCLQAGSHTELPRPYEVIFSDTEQKNSRPEPFASMAWAYPELRQMTRLIVMPVPLDYETDLIDKSQVVEVCFLH